MLEHDAALEDEKPSGEAARDVFEEAMQRFDDAVLPQLPVREKSLAARRFVSVPGAQWDGEWGELWSGALIKAEINKVGRILRKIENDYRQNRIVPDFRPAGGDSDNDTADTLDGMHRADSYYFKAQQARDNAFSEAGAGGFGAYRQTTEWADPLDKDCDEQRVNPGLQINDADLCVFFDPNSKLYDKSDARFAFVLTQVSPEAYKRQWGDDKIVSFPEGVLRSYEWFSPDHVVQAEYYTIEEIDEDLLIFTLEASGEEERYWKSEIADGERARKRALGWKFSTQKRKRKRCHKYVLSGAEILSDQGTIPGSNIPISPVYCYRFYVDGVEWFKGVVQDKMDAQRRYNAGVSRIAEIDSLAAYERPIFDPEQVASPSIQKSWARGNIDRAPYALASALRDEDGKVAHIGPIGMVQPPQVPPTTAALLQAANADLSEDDQDVDQVVANTSADAMDLAAARVDAKSGFMLDNMRQTVQREGEIYLGMACEVYIEDDREVETMTEDGDDGVAKLNEPYRDGEVLKTRNNFAAGRYKVVASVTEATTTRRDRTVKQMLHVAEVSVGAQDIEGAQAALIVAGTNMDGEGISDWSAWQRARGIKLGMIKPNEDEQRQMAEEAQQQQAKPDPAAEVGAAQVKALEAGAQKDMATAGKVVADTALSKAKTIETLANAAETRVKANLAPIEAANDAQPMPAPKIRFGRDLAQ